MSLSHLIHRLIYPCREVTLLLEKADHVPLSLLERLRLRLHLSVCSPCTSYRHKRLMLARWAKEQADAQPTPDATEVARLQERLRTQLGLTPEETDEK